MKKNMNDYNQFGIKKFEKVKINEKGNKSEKKTLKKKVKNPPKRQNSKKITNNMSVEIVKTTENSKINATSKTNLKKKTVISQNKSSNSHSNKNKLKKRNKVSFDSNDSSEEVTNIKKKEQLDNFELNNLDYNEACELDKRGFCKTYWSVLMREHVMIFTCFTCYDYNLLYVKIERFLTLICIEMTVNGLFFIHESMYRKYTGQELTFVQKIPQILFTLIACHIIEVILCFFGMTDTHVYEIKALQKHEKNAEKIVNIMDKMRNKLIGFFIFTFLLFLFNWYFISAFCAVYQNTQKIFIRDSAISFLTSMIDPFIIYGVTTLLRYISLVRCCKKKLCCIYKLSDLIPIF